MSAGRTRLQNIMLDLLAIAMQAHKGTTKLLSLCDTAIEIDLSDDGHWKAADDALTLAREFIGNGRTDDATAELIKAQSALRKGMTIDFSDLSKEQLRALIMPQIESLEAAQAEIKKLLEAIK